MDNNMVKIMLAYEEDDKVEVESVWAKKEGEYYRIDNIPFFAPNIAWNDLISAEKEEDGALYFEALIKPSGHSTVQMIFFNEEDTVPAAKELEKFGCSWESSHIKKILAVDIPKEVNYLPIKIFLNMGVEAERWSYKESCLAHKIE
jgi:hypothetical protein